MGVSVVTPTYREADNIRPLAERIRTTMEAAGVDWELILADDDSRDGSEEVALELGRSLPVRLHVRRARPRDLSQSVLDGIRLARFDRLVVMDADLSHPPEQIPELLAALDGDAGMALGSRYAPGGRIVGAWSRYRTLNSRIATWLTRPLTRCADPMSGFFAVDRRHLPGPDELAPIGYKIALELIVRGRLRVREVAIRFRDRQRGASKLNWRQQVAFLRHLHRLYTFRFGLPVRMLSFGAVGLSGLVVDTAVYLGLQLTGVGHLLARFLSFWPAVTWNWRLNRLLTFNDRPADRPVPQWAKFAVASGVGLLTNVGSYAVLTSFVAPFTERTLLALFAGVVIGSAVNFATSTRFVYPQRRTEE
ncbi:MAG: glycosyltransferase family 2 protein [Gammaproteobacteria bacterium]|nr:glycosyltransferase family 2 protein [Gammaproteobacteria bacterium]